MVRVRALAVRHSETVAMVVAALTLAGSVAALAMDRALTGEQVLDGSSLVYTVCQLLPYGLVGAVLIARRPDLPFGWLLALAALVLVVFLAVAVPSFYAFDRGSGSTIALWGVSFGSVAWVPAALEGLINVRFPTGRPIGRFGRTLDRTLRWGIPVVLVAAFLSDWPAREGIVGGRTRFIDATPIPTIANALLVGVPVLILLGVVAGLGVVVRCWHATGLERKQLQWRAAGVLIGLALFPFVVTEAMPDWFDELMPFVFVATLVIPILRYDLWAIDSIVRRSAGYTVTAPGSVPMNLVRATAEMLRLPYAAVLRDGTPTASYGEPTALVRAWPLRHGDEQVGELAASPPFGRTEFTSGDEQVLSTVAQLVGGMVHADGLTQDLQDARQRLVTAREEERRRLRRDLHDGLGPLLAGLGLNLDAASAQLGRDDAKSAMYLGNAQEASQQVISSLREVVSGLRPPALDDLGFAQALRMHLDRIARDADLDITLTTPEPLCLPAAVEVAAFRTAVEAANNVSRHSDAAHVCVSVDEVDGTLSVRVTDDGTPTGPWRGGVGLRSMRERVEELGGTMSAGSTTQGGRVQVTYPLERIAP